MRREISQSITERTRELGIRTALGARAENIVLMVLGEGLVAVAIGVAIGLAAALALTSVLASLLFGVTRFDAVTFSAVTLLMFATATIAAALPARRASRLSPISAMGETAGTTT